MSQPVLGRGMPTGNSDQHQHGEDAEPEGRVPQQGRKTIQDHGKGKLCRGEDGHRGKSTNQAIE